MTTTNRSRHNKQDIVAINDANETEVKLDCSCGWQYTTTPQFLQAVVQRHEQEADLLSA